MSSLNDRIAAALSATLTSGELADLIAEVTRATVTHNDDRQRAERRALDPRLSEQDVEKARDDMERSAFAARRLDSAVVALHDALQKANAREAEARRRDTYAEALAARDAAAAALRERYPTLALELRDLLQQVVNSDRLVAAANQSRPQGAPYLEPVEEQVRGVRADGQHAAGMVGTLARTVILPALDIPSGAMTPMIWNGRLVP